MRRTLVVAVLALGACAHARPAAGPQPTPGGATPATAEPAAIRPGVAPPAGPYAAGFDAIHYEISIVLPDTGTLIRGRTRVSIAVVAARQDTLPLDLTGLAVDSVRMNGAHARYRYTEGKLRIAVPRSARTGDTLSVEVMYHGHPRDGLIIGPNVHGTRTAFADNWPDRARFWFPCIDHPSDKATVDFEVRAPRAWAVVANGRPVLPAPDPEAGGRPADSGVALSRWTTDVPIPTYTMVLGAARFDTASVTATPAAPVPPGPPVSRWLFPEDTAGRRSFRRAADIVAWYSTLIAPFPYEKLAHVESSTKFGGMENASAIFYDEKAIAAGANIEQTVAHETAHQWFGDAVTEGDWHHLWLSEGFATYFGALYFEHADGEARFRAIMARNKAEYLGSADTARPVIDESERDLFRLLNANNYQKGAWVLHMLRGLVGDSAFFQGIRRYYQDHRNGNALTPDLQRALEAASGLELGWFFHQWLEEPGYPRLRLERRWLAERQALEVRVLQLQPAAWPAFRFPLQLELATSQGPVRREIQVSGRDGTFRLPLPSEPTALSADPDGRLLLVVEPPRP